MNWLAITFCVAILGLSAIGVALVGLSITECIVYNGKQALLLHYDFLKDKNKEHQAALLSEAMEKKLKEFDELKKRVDALTLKAGFKL
jgi:hypothetical protein